VITRSRHEIRAAVSDETGELFGEIDDVGPREKGGSVVGPRILLQADEDRIGVKDRRQPLQRNRAIMVVEMNRIAGPDQADAQPVMGTKPGFPALHQGGRGRRHIPRHRRYGLEPRSERERQARQRTVQIEIWKRACRLRQA
jgi:hypothetical protein